MLRALLITLVFTCSLCLYRAGTLHWAPVAAAAAGMACAAWFALPKLAAQPMRVRRYLWIFAAVFGLATALGRALQAADSLVADAASALTSGVIAVGFAAGCAHVLALLLLGGQTALPVGGDGGLADTRRVFWIALALLLLGWLPVYLAFYPGVYAYDVNNQAMQCFTGQYDTQHPLLHTLLLKAGYLLGAALRSPTDGLGVITILQLLATALGLSYGVALLRRMGAARRAVYGITAFFALLPVFPVMAISTTKDALFAVAFTLSMLQLYQYLQALRNGFPARGAAWACAGWMILSMLLRNNALYAYAFGAAAGWLVLRGRAGKRLAMLSAASVAAALCLSAALAFACGAGSHTGVYEMFTIPAQQLRRAELQTRDSADRDAMAECFLASVPAEAGYQPTFGDIARYSLNTTVYGWNDPNTDIPVNPDQILKTWLTMAPRYPVAYLEAFFQTNRGSWYLDDTSHAEIYGKPGHGVGYLVTTFNDTSQWVTVTRRSVLPGLADALSWLLSDNAYQRIPVLSRILGTGFQVWLFFLCMLACLIKRRRGLFCVCLFPFGLWLTLLLGPCTLVRYIYPFFMLNPLLLGMIFAPRRT